MTSKGGNAARRRLRTGEANEPAVRATREVHDASRMQRSSWAQALAVSLRFVPHALAAAVAVAVARGDLDAVWWIGGFFLLAPVVELVLGQEDGQRSPAGRCERLACRLSPWLWIPLQAAVLVAGIFAAAHVATPMAVVWPAVLTGLLCGIFGLTAAHELMHRRERGARAAAMLLLAFSGYAHFCVEHVRGHHRRVGTRDDGATARLGETIYVFLCRSIASGIVSAWRSERERLARYGLGAWSARNRVIAGWMLSTALCLFAAWAAGVAGVVFFATQAAVGIIILEVSNYVQHYGLTRREIESGVYARIEASHAWDCRFRLTNLLLLDLGRHSDHHLEPALAADQLKARSEAPRLPAGYFSLFAVTFLPPLWMVIMNRRARWARTRVGRMRVHTQTPLARRTSHSKHDHAGGTPDEDLLRGPPSRTDAMV